MIERDDAFQLKVTEYRAAKQTTTARTATITKIEKRLIGGMIGRRSNRVDPSRGNLRDRGPLVAQAGPFPRAAPGTARMLIPGPSGTPDPRV
jgi:hypothetical protein